ncbi:MAG: hypothetical protein KDB22_02800 [Planctomycetales bacterium]|nr:hypothetical protein [Planctomycetales bacterium]
MNTKRLSIRAKDAWFSRVVMRHCRRYGASSRRGVTLLEMVIAGSLLAVVVTSLSVVLRTARVAWEVSDDDYAAMHYAQSVARHFVRQAREARTVTSMPAGGAGISLQLRDGSTLTWQHIPAGDGTRENVVFVTFSDSGQQIPLAYNISNLSFTGYAADGVTATTNLADIRLIEIRVAALVSGGSKVQTEMAKVWVRAW